MRNSVDIQLPQVRLTEIKILQSPT